ncbi:efflux RND transporter periplasmic adaptor subunit [Acidimangrovimonas sediminis]|uniref:efflux RND transporter periplasmic adaptor subunit n=1 Tax=Acidimangrovimonas sediminis TaxID=2056283 RepID=UPI000C801591|nr:efflux RND transporter periplasmic adaptor subunit [Acidimangrovimonas sediminis]
MTRGQVTGGQVTGARTIRRAGCLACAAAIAVATGQAAIAQRAGGKATGPTSVGVVTLSDGQVPYQVTLPGRAVAYEQVDIRPRVEGVVEEIPYKPGHKVAKGDVLFRINRDDYQATDDAAKASVAQAEASLKAAQLTLDRYKSLENKGITAEQVSTAQVAVAEAKATLLSAKASLDTADLNLDRTVIRSPITGIPDVASVSVGALVTANQTTALTTVTRLDPVYVDVEESIQRINQVRDEIAAGRLKAGDTLDVSLKFDSGPDYKGKGTLVSPGATVSTSTGTTTFRFQFDNPDRRILPGMFVRVDVTLGTVNAILVPQGPTSRDGNGDLTAFIDKNGEASQVKLTTSGTYQNSWIVTGGVKAGDKLIVDGLTNLRDKEKIKTVPVTISKDGVVTEVKDAAGSTGDSTDASTDASTKDGADATSTTQKTGN